MKEEADKVRSWKMKKEKEVNQLKQAERKQQVQLTKMANLNAKQQNVLRRKMEEAVAANKRLKDVIDKQKAAKKMQSMGKQGKKGNLCKGSFLNYVDKRGQVGGYLNFNITK